VPAAGLFGEGEERAIPIVMLQAPAVQAIRSFLNLRGWLQRPLRIDLQASGCCDPSLGLRVDAIRKSDLIQETDGLVFVISPEIHRLAGEVTIRYVDESHRQGFILTSSKPVSEWDGFSVSSISCPEI
jgi:Fe-S cluster assembly iron-binding protein IscA